MRDNMRALLPRIFPAQFQFEALVLTLLYASSLDSVFILRQSESCTDIAIALD